VPIGAPADESNERNDHTYRPWFGFRELQSVAEIEAALLREPREDTLTSFALQANALGTLDRLATDPSLGPLARAALRGLLLMKFLDYLGSRSRSFKEHADELRNDLVRHIDWLGCRGAMVRVLRDELAS
jgi:hypothetical protein